MNELKRKREDILFHITREKNTSYYHIIKMQNPVGHKKDPWEIGRLFYSFLSIKPLLYFSLIISGTYRLSECM
jgi:hypothetical protein